MNKYKLAIFASGRGSNAEKIIDHFKNSETVSIDLIVTNKEKAMVLDLAKKNAIPQFVIANKKTFTTSNSLIETLQEKGITHIILAGFLWLIPTNLINAYPNRIINIHPALLPKYGGKGMYGMNVHKAVKANREVETGITIHLVNERYDDGKHLSQQRCELTSSDSAEQIAKKVLGLEHYHYPRVIEKYLAESS